MGEIADGSYVITDVKPTIISGLGAIPKPDSSEVRFIRDCSRPPWRAFNDYISCSSFKFQTLENAIKMLQANYFMAKIDLPHTYLSVPIHKSNYQATGLQWYFAVIFWTLGYLFVPSLVLLLLRTYFMPAM